MVFWSITRTGFAVSASTRRMREPVTTTSLNVTSEDAGAVGPVSVASAAPATELSPIDAAAPAVPRANPIACLRLRLLDMC
jgi:hypothetical protein